MLDYEFTCKERFLKYVKYDTQSDENSGTYPSSEKQNVFLRELLSELKGMDVDAIMDESGYVYAHIKSNTNKKVTPIGFIAHVDTSPAAPASNIHPIFHKNYQGGNIKLPKDNQMITAADSLALHDKKGHDIITSDGSTLLGADDKSGVTEIMDAVNYIAKNPQIKHGDIMFAFTTDEEIGRGVEKFDIQKFGAKYAYTLDGENVGETEIETFNGDRIIITITGKSTHTGYGKNKMINSLKIAAEFISKLPKNRWSPETTDGMDGFAHVDYINGNEGFTIVKMLVRDFDEKKLIEYEEHIRKMMTETILSYPGATFNMEVIEQYRNMKKILDKHPQVAEYAMEAMRNIGIKPYVQTVRGGTDGCRLSYMGLPTPNIFSGEHNFHSKTEWVSVQDMELAVEMIIEICKVWEQKGQ